MTPPAAESGDLDSILNEFASQVVGLQGDDLAAFEDLEFYSRYVMDGSGLSSNSSFLKRVYNSLQYEDDDLLILGPRGSAKSTAVTVNYMSWSIGRNNLIRFMLAVASVEGQGVAFGRQIEQIMTANERYIRIFGELKPSDPSKWTQTEKIVNRVEPPGGMKDSTITIVGLNSSIPSKRADKIIIDDIVTQENAYSEKERASTRRLVLQSMRPILVPGGRMIVVGSLWDERDLYMELMELWRLTPPEPSDIDIDALIEQHVGGAHVVAA